MNLFVDIVHFLLHRLMTHKITVYDIFLYRQTLTRNTLDCDQSNYSSRIVFSHIPIVLGQTGIKIRRTRKPHIRTKHGVNRTIRRGDIAI